MEAPAPTTLVLVSESPPSLQTVVNGVKQGVKYAKEITGHVAFSPRGKNRKGVPTSEEVTTKFLLSTAQ